MKSLLMSVLFLATTAQAKSINFVCQSAQNKASLVVVSKMNSDQTRLILTAESNGQSSQYYSVFDGFQSDEFHNGNNTTSLVKSAQTRRSQDRIEDAGLILIEPISNMMVGNQPQAKVTFSIKGHVTEYTCKNRF